MRMMIKMKNKQLNKNFKRNSHQLVQSKSIKLDPYFISGLADAESTFRIIVCKNNKSKTGWSVTAVFSIELNKIDSNLLNLYKDFFNVGRLINVNSKNTEMYTVTKLKDIIEYIIPHFLKYPLLTKKKADFIIFSQIVELMKNKEHLNTTGILKILGLKASLNKGLSDELIKAFPNYVLVERPKIELPESINFNWLAGFVNGEGCFFVQIGKDKTYKTGYRVTLIFTLTQHIRDLDLIKLIAHSLNCGIVTTINQAVYLRVTKIGDILNIIIPIFNKYNIQGKKVLDFHKFCKIALLVNDQKHRTLEGLEEIRKIKSDMNSTSIL